MFTKVFSNQIIFKLLTEIFDEETNEIPEYFFNNTFCNTGRVKKDMEEFLNNPIVKRILRDK